MIHPYFSPKIFQLLQGILLFIKHKETHFINILVNGYTEDFTTLLAKQFELDRDRRIGGYLPWCNSLLISHKNNSSFILIIQGFGVFLP